MGKWWENGDLMGFKWDIIGICQWSFHGYPLVNVYITMENHHA